MEARAGPAATGGRPAPVPETQEERVTWFIEDRPPRGYAARVQAVLAGGYERGSISVADHTVPAGAGATVFLVPPEVVVRVQLVSAGAGRYAFAVTINGRTVRERGTLAAGKTRIERAYPFAAFGLDPAAPPPDEGARRGAGAPERQRIGGIPLPPGVRLRTRGTSVPQPAEKAARKRARASGPDSARSRRSNDLNG